MISTGENAMTSIDEGPLALNAFLDPTRLLKQVLDALEALVIVIDRDGRIVHFNQVCERITGFAAEHMLGAPFVEALVPPDRRAKVRVALDQLFTEASGLSWESTWTTQGGEESLIRWTASLIDDEVGRASRGVVTGIDVTRRRALENEVVSADEELRQQFGAELHDMLASHLAGTSMMASALVRKVKKGESVGTKELRRLTDLIRDAMEQVRALSHSFVAPELDTDDFVEALDQLAKRTEAASGIPCTYAACEVEREAVPSGEVATHLYRIAQEALHNAVTHAAPGHLELTLGVEEKHSGERVLALTVRDDGRGLPEEAEEGVGLRNMQRRARLMNATLCVEPGEGGGTEVRCSVPLSAASLLGESRRCE